MGISSHLTMRLLDKKRRHQLYLNCTVCIDVPALIDGTGVSLGSGTSMGLQTHVNRADHCK